MRDLVAELLARPRPAVMDRMLVQAADRFAWDAHYFRCKTGHPQQRRYSGADYMIHPREVALLLAQVGFGPEVVAAALCHDTVEDTHTWYGMIRAYLGQRTADLVMEASDVSVRSDGNRAARKALDRAHAAKASPEGQSLKYADLISNTRSIIACDPGYARVYIPEKLELLHALDQGHEGLRALAYDQVRMAAHALDLRIAAFL